MKISNFSILKKNIDNLDVTKTKLFLVISPDVFEKEKIIKEILSSISKNTQVNVTRFSKVTSLDEIFNVYNSMSLLGGHMLALIDDLNLIFKNDLPKLNEYIKKNNVFFIAGSQNKSLASGLYQTVEKNGLVFDLSQEKFWEKEKRIANFAIEKCMKAKKNISAGVIDTIFSKVGVDFALVEKEVEKLLLYTMEKKSIELEDVENICPTNMTQSIWQIAEKIVWDQITFDNFSIDSSFFHQLLSSIRYNLQIGYKIASLVEMGKGSELNVAFPKMYPRLLEKRKEIATRYSTKYFKKALQIIFETDVLSKSCSLMLLDYLKLKLLFLQLYDINSFA